MKVEEWREAVVVAALVNREGGRVEIGLGEIAALRNTDIVVYEDIGKDCVVVEVKRKPAFATGPGRILGVAP